MELGEVVRTAVTTRFFSSDPVPDTVLAKAFDYARFAPNGGNRQPVSFVVVRDAAHKKQLQEWYLQPWKAYLAAAQTGDINIGSQGDNLPRVLRNADHMAEHLHEVPVIVVACFDPEGVHPTDTELGRLSIVGGGSVYPAVQNFILGCREAGLGTALTTLLCLFEPQVKELLGIPDNIGTAAHIAVGYRTKPFPTKLDRKPLSEMVFDGRWGAPLATG
jgi:nitroreductase